MDGNGVEETPIIGTVEQQVPVRMGDRSPQVPSSRLRKNSMLHLFLGGAALQRCGNCTVFSAALAAEVAHSALELVFPQPASVLSLMFVYKSGRRSRGFDRLTWSRQRVSGSGCDAR